MYQLDVNDAMIYIISMGFLFLVLNSIRSLVGYFIKPIFDRAFYYLYVDIVLLVFIIGATVILDYSDVFDEDRIDLNYLTHALSIFTLSWLIFGIILIFTG